MTKTQLHYLRLLALENGEIRARRRRKNCYTYRFYLNGQKYCGIQGKTFRALLPYLRISRGTENAPQIYILNEDAL